MNSLRKCLSILILINCTALCRDFNKIVQISIPKTGTHLLAKCITLLTNKHHIVWSDRTNTTFEYQKLFTVSMDELQALTSLTESEFWMPHLFYSKEYADYLTINNFTNFFIYRDPRDQVVSFAFYMLKYKNLWPKASTISFDELIMDIITEGTTLNKIPPTKNIATLYYSYLPWISDPSILSVKFEDLVGVKGGGSEVIQLQTIQTIASYLGINLSQEEALDVSNKLFGDTYSFREGKINSWKKHFKQEHIEAFKEVAGDLLIKLGYEKDVNWKASFEAN